MAVRDWYEFKAAARSAFESYQAALRPLLSRQILIDPMEALAPKGAVYQADQNAT
jgi:hypothetical protein